MDSYFNKKGVIFSISNKETYKSWIKEILLIPSGEVINTKKDYKYYEVENTQIPVARSIGKLHLAKDEYTVSRDSEAYEFNENGYFSKVKPNVPRIDFTNKTQELLVEKGSTNFAFQSNNKNMFNYGSNKIVSYKKHKNPIGIEKVINLIPDKTEGRHSFCGNNQLTNEAISKGEIISMSFMVKANGYNFIEVGGYFRNEKSQLDIKRNIILSKTENVISTRIKELSNGWKLIKHTYKFQDGIKNGYLYAGLPNISKNKNFSPFSGDGVKGVLFCNMQIEKSIYPTSLILTNGSIKSRPDDIITDSYGEVLPFGRYPLIGDNLYTNFFKKINNNKGSIINGDLLLNDENTPIGRKVGKLYSYNNQDYIVIRDSDSYEFNINGIFDKIDKNIPRIDWVYNKQTISVYGKSTNLLKYSWDFSNPWWTKNGTEVEAVYNELTGKNDAYKCTNLNTGNKNLQQQESRSDFNYSIYAKAGSSNIIRLAMVIGDSSYVDVDLSNGDIFNKGGLGEAEVIYIKNGWYRIIVKKVIGTTIRASFYPAFKEPFKYIYVWNFEVGDNIGGPPILTNGEALTVNSDIVTNNYFSIGRYLVNDNTIGVSGKLINYQGRDYEFIRRSESYEFNGNEYIKINENIPKFDYLNNIKELLIEPSRTNYNPYFNFKVGKGNLYTTSVYIEENINFGLDIINSHLVMEYNQENNTAYYFVNVNKGKEYTISCYIKRSDGTEPFLNNNREFRFRLGGSFLNHLSYKKLHIKDDIYRVWVTDTPTRDGTCGFLRTPSSEEIDIYISGLQVEGGSTVTSPILTNGEIDTRDMDLVINKKLKVGNHENI